MVAALADAAQIRVLPVSAPGAERGWTLLDQALSDISPSGFIAVDTEFSGLSEDPRLNDKDLSIRYEAWRELAEKRAILSLGVSLFNPIEKKGDPELAEKEEHEPEPDEDVKAVAGCNVTAAKVAVKLMRDEASAPNEHSNGIANCDETTVNAKPSTPAKKSAAYSVTTLEFLLRCNSPFEIVSDAGAFLVAHGFDFNEMFCSGIGYNKVGKSEDAQGAFPWGPYPRGFLWRLGRAAVPIVLHNGFMDLVFMYSSFHAPLPKTLNGFLSKLLDCVPAGFWDTKVLAMGPGNESVSFLNYVFAHAVMQDLVRVSNRKNLPPDQTTRPVQQVPLVKTELCALYAMRGYCNNGTRCQDIHDPFMVVEGKLNGTLPTDFKKARKLYKKQSKKAKAAARLREAEERKKKPKLNKKAQVRLVAAELAEKAKGVEEALQAIRGVQIETPDGKEKADVEGSPDEHSEGGGTPRKRLRSEHDKKSLENGHPRKTAKSILNLKLGDSNLAASGAADGEGGTTEGKSKLLSNARYRHRLNERAHSAGWDAFCTGYAFANYRLTLSKDKLDGLHNRINLVKKKTPLLLCKSLFTDPEEAERKDSEEKGDGEKHAVKSVVERTESP